MIDMPPLQFAPTNGIRMGYYEAGPTPHTPRAPADPIELFKKRFGDSMYIVQFQDRARGPDMIFGSRVEQTFDAFMRKPLPRKHDASAQSPTAGVGASPKTNLAFPQMI